MVFKDELSLPPYTGTGRDTYVWQGKLQVKGVVSDIVHIPDIDGDGVKELMASKASNGEVRLELMTSWKSKRQQLKVPLRSVVLIELMLERFVKAMDINNDGQQEIILVGKQNQGAFLFLLHYDGANWRSEIVPLQLVHDYPNIFTMQVGRSKRLVLFSAYKNECQMIWHDGRKWRERRWRFKGRPTMIWEEKGTWRMLITRCIWLSEYSFWQVLRKWCFNRSYAVGLATAQLPAVTAHPAPISVLPEGRQRGSPTNPCP
ncbi:MAG: hypothetical protein ACK4I8_10170, partial [Armatimonadota bacterium]